MSLRPTLGLALVTGCILALAGCKPPPTDEAGARGAQIEFRKGPSEPIDSPDSTNAIWAASATPGRIIYGNPGERPMLALTCESDAAVPAVRITRYALADEGAGAFLALIGNSHIARVPVDATASGNAFLWEGRLALDDPDIEVLTGLREVTATLPGAGMITLNASDQPRTLIDACRGTLPEVPETLAPSAEPALNEGAAPVR